MALTVYQYPKCDTCRKAVKWLQAQGHDPVLIDIKEHPPSAKDLKKMLALSDLPLKKFFNTSGEVYKELGLKDKLASMSEDEQLALLAAHGMLIKRPLATDGKKVTLGFKPEAYNQEWAVKKA
ncbi:hypothetical protein SY83_22485 [Paenibacillus swuensis]|uniref:ArsC family transcriptional regulator n=1 Tax=Paenibacillus swuensis TaxID=1178515 RepID=A0A172TNF9_9BACL|nr:arsenate reductase family protein [Paenibacillus swuensis]ANE48595.1 hypothetical protein SY83_22485 [Paenibacillus swuensis]